MKLIIFCVVFLCVGGGAYASSAFDVCPLPNAVHYNRRASKFQGRSREGIIWKSAVVAAEQPLPAVQFKEAVAKGNKKHASVLCYYRIGRNTIQLRAFHAFPLNGSWSSVQQQDNFFVCNPRKGC